MRFANSSLSSSLRLASAAGLLTVLAVSAGHAQSTQLLAPPAGYTVTTTDAYPLNNDNGGFIDGPFTVAAGNVAAGGTNVTYTATNSGLHSFETFDNFDSSLDFAQHTNLIDTFDTQSATGPLLISFSSGVTAFGIKAESSQQDTAIFSFTAYDGNTIIGQYTLAPVSQAFGDPHSIFLGAQVTGGSLITSVKISDTSVATGNGFTDTSGTNDFYVGPLSTYTAPVPEASTTVSFGLLLALGLGGAIVSARKKMGSAKASTA